MRFIEWLRPGINIKRWIVLGLIGVIFLSYGIAIFMTNEIALNYYGLTAISYIFLGVMLIIVSIIFIGRTLIKAINEFGFTGRIDSKTIRSSLIDKKLLENGPNVVAIGGGTGLSTMLRGIKEFTSNVTAVVTVSDDGGGSGMLRSDLGMLPPGDIRNCILALARTEPILEKLLQYRFEEGMLKGQNFGNLFLAAMTGTCGSFEEAVQKMSDVLAVTGDVLPVTVSDIKLCAELEDGSIVIGETNIISECKNRSIKIKRVFLEPANVPALPEVIKRIKEADAIILGPGSLYSSIIPNLLINEVCDAINESSAIKIFVCNIMTQKGETDNYTVYEHIKSIFSNTKLKIIDFCIANRAPIKDTLKQKYVKDGSKKVIIDENKIIKSNIKLIKTDVIDLDKGFIRHNHRKLASVLFKLINQEIKFKDKRNVIDYLYTKGRIKKIASGQN